MIYLGAYNGRELQNFLSLLNQFDSDGIKDIWFAKEHIQRHIDNTMGAKRAGKMRENKTIERTEEANVLCPDCGGNMSRSSFYPALTCPKCLHSEVIR